MSPHTEIPLRSSQTEHEVSFTSFDQWRAWLSAHPQMQSPDYIRELIAYVQRHGAQSKYLGHISPEEVRVLDANYRESLLARGFNPRLRAVLDLLADLPVSADTWSTRIYAPEALTPFALLLAGRYARFVGSEYAHNDEQRRFLFPIRAEDLLNLSFPSGVFDVVLSNEVFEHVPNLERSLAEVARVLKPGGTLLATFPFAYGLADTLVRAWFENGQLCYNGPPEYHGNPVDPAGGSLVFQIPAWDVLDLCGEVGFSSVRMLFISSYRRGITGAEIAGVHVLRAIR